MAPITEPPRRDFTKAQPVAETFFKAYASLYTYDKTPLQAVTQFIDDNNPRWRRELVTFNAAYGNERMSAYPFSTSCSVVVASGSVCAKCSHQRLQRYQRTDTECTFRGASVRCVR